MTDYTKCSICNKLVDADKDSYTWDEEPAHAKCVIDKAETICKDECGQLGIESGGMCGECGEDMIPLTKKKKKEMLKNL